MIDSQPQAICLAAYRSVDSQRVGLVADREHGTAASTAGLARSGEADPLESLLQRVKAMETSIAGISSSLQSPSVEHLLQRITQIECLLAAKDSTEECVRLNAVADRCSVAQAAHNKQQESENIDQAVAAQHVQTDRQGSTKELFVTVVGLTIEGLKHTNQRWRSK